MEHQNYLIWKTPSQKKYCVPFRLYFPSVESFRGAGFKLLLIMKLTCFTTTGLQAQDAEFSQFYAAPLHLNPAFAGVGTGPRVVLNYRNQWPELNNAFITYDLSYDQEVKALQGGIGIELLSDHLSNNLVSLNSANFSYSYQIGLSRNFGLKAGMGIGFSQYRLHPDLLVFGGQIDPLSGSVNSTGGDPLPATDSRTYMDVNAGALLYSKRFFMGIAAKHLTKPNISFYNNDATVPLRLAANFGYQINLKKKSSLTPDVLYAEQGKFHQINAGAYLKISDVFGGIFYRNTNNTGDALIFMLGLQHDFFRFGYSYDWTLSDLTGVSGGAHELSIIFNYHDSKKAAQKPNWDHFTQCPVIF